MYCDLHFRPSMVYMYMYSCVHEKCPQYENGQYE